MGGAGKGPGIGWSRAQPKYSWEANLYATRWFCADRSRTEQQWKISRTVCQYFRVCAIQELKIHLIAYYSNATSLWKSVPALRCHVQNMSNVSELRQARVVLQEIHRDCGITVRSSGKWFCPMSNKKGGPLLQGSAVNLNKLNLIEIELFIKMLYGVWSSLQPDHETNKSLRRMQVSPPDRNDDRSPIWNIWRPLISFLFRG